MIRRTPDGAFALGLEYFEYQTTASAIVFVAVRRPVRAAAPARTSRSTSRPTRAGASPTAPRACSACSRTRWSTSRARCIRRRACRICASAAASRSTAWPTPGSSPNRASSACSCRLRRAMPGCALGAALYADRIYFRNPDRDVPDHPFWGPAVDASELARAAREDGQPVEELDELDAHRADRRRTRRRPHRRLDGRRVRVRTARARPSQHPGRAAFARDARPAQSRHQVPRGVPAVRAGRADRGGRALLRAAAGGARLARFMSGVFPVRPEWRARLAAITHVDGSARRAGARARDGAAAVRAARGVRAAQRRCRCCSTRRSTWPASRSSIAPSKGIRRSAAAAIDALVAGDVVVTKARSPQPPRRRCRVITKRGRMRRRLIMLATAGGSIARSGARLVAQRFRQAVAGAAGGLSVRVRLGADCSRRRSRRWRRSSTRSSERMDASGSCSPARRARARSRRTGRVATAARRVDRARRDSGPARFPATSAPKRCAGSTMARRFPATRRATACRRCTRGPIEALRAPARSGDSRRRANRGRRLRDGADVPVSGARRSRRVGADLTRASLRLGRGCGATVRARSGPVRRDGFAAARVAAGAFDVVYSSGVLHHTPDPRASFARLVRLVRPGGTIVLGVYNAFARVPLRLRRVVARRPASG